MKRKMSEWTEYNAYDDDDRHQVVQSYCYQFVMFLTI
jgi:hypothetical protein